jgi:hypothetical protein
VRSTHHPVQWVLGFVSSTKRPGCVSDYSSPFIVEVKNEWSCASTPPRSLHDVDRDKHTYSCRWHRPVVFYQKVFFLCYEKHNYIDLLYWFSFNSATCFDLLFCFRNNNNNNNKFYNRRIITVCLERLLPFFTLLVKQYSYPIMAEINSRNM